MNNETTQIPDETQPVSPTDTELDTLRSENTELRTQLRLRTARDEITKVLTAENARSPELLFDAISSRLAFGDDGQLNNSTELLADLKTRFPEQFVIAKN